MRKVLISPRHGAGWTSWHCGTREEKLFMLEYQPFIEALERGEPLPVEQFEREWRERFGEDVPYLGGLRDLKVVEVPGEIEVEEYDGWESIRHKGEGDWI